MEPRIYRFEVAWSGDALSKNPQHLALHAAKIAGKLAAYQEFLDHGGVHTLGTIADLKAKRIPDLVILACMLAEAHGVDLEKAVAQRSREVSGSWD